MKKGDHERPPNRLCPKIAQWNYFKKRGTAGGDFYTNPLPILPANYYLVTKVQILFDSTKHLIWNAFQKRKALFQLFS